VVGPVFNLCKMSSKSVSVLLQSYQHYIHFMQADFRARFLYADDCTVCTICNELYMCNKLDNVYTGVDAVEMMKTEADSDDVIQCLFAHFAQLQNGALNLSM